MTLFHPNAETVGRQGSSADRSSTVVVECGRSIDARSLAAEARTQLLIVIK